MRVDWVCLSGRRIAGPRPASPNKLPPAPNCEPKLAPLPSASASPLQSAGSKKPRDDEEDSTPIWTFPLVGAVLVAIVLVVVKSREYANWFCAGVGHSLQRGQPAWIGMTDPGGG